MSNALIDQLNGAVRSRHPLIYIHGPEENRVLDALDGIAGDRSVRQWSCVSGLDGADAAVTSDPVEALKVVEAADQPTFFIFKDLSAHMDRADVVRSLRSAYYRQRGIAEQVIIVVSPDVNIPQALEGCCCCWAM